jgi:hypothetical protein
MPDTLTDAAIYIALRAEVMYGLKLPPFPTARQKDWYRRQVLKLYQAPPDTPLPREFFDPMPVDD